MRTMHPACGLALAALVIGTSASSANPRGEPRGLKAGLPACYAVWFSKDRWHLRVTTAEKLRHFKGSIKVDGGRIDNITSHLPEKDGTAEDHWILSPDKKTILFDFKTMKGLDGINFHVTKEAKHIELNLLIDGKHHPDKIWIGAGKERPKTEPFSLPAHPGKK